MRIFLQTPPAETEAPRYYQLALQQDLLGGWTLHREWGQQGASKQSVKNEFYLDRDSALVAFVRARDLQLKRGYLVMFSQGMDGGHAN